jgi:chromosome segregation ATPase
MRESDELPGLTLSQDDISERKRKTVHAHGADDKVVYRGVSQSTFWLMCFVLVSLSLAQGWYLYQLMNQEKSGAEGLQQELTLTQGKINEMKQVLEGFNGQLAEREREWAEKLKKVEKDQGRVLAMNEQGNKSLLDAMRGRNGQLEGGLEKLRSDVTQLGADVSKVSALAESLEGGKAKTQKTLSELQGELEAIRKKQESWKESQTQLQSLVESLGQMEGRIASHQKELSAVSDSIGKLTAKSDKPGDSLKATVDSHSQSLESINAFRRQVNSSLDQIYAELRKLESRGAR